MITRALLLLLLSGAASPALADWTPSRPVKLIVAFAPGGRSLWDRQWIDPSGASAQEAAAVIREETARWASAARMLDLSAQ